MIIIAISVSNFMGAKVRKICKGTCPSGQVPLLIIVVTPTPPQQPARRLTDADYQHVTANLGNIWETL
jgi:hypothetical protein